MATNTKASEPFDAEMEPDTVVTVGAASTSQEAVSVESVEDFKLRLTKLSAVELSSLFAFMISADPIVNNDVMSTPTTKPAPEPDDEEFSPRDYVVSTPPGQAEPDNAEGDEEFDPRAYFVADAPAE
jgi:hypothetical protein